MRFDIITIFPNMFDSYFGESILKRARASKLVDIRVHNLRDYTGDKHKKVGLRQAQGDCEPRRTIALRQAQGDCEPRRTIALRQAQAVRPFRRTVDDRPYGGGPGMVMQVAPLAAALQKIVKKKKHLIILFSAAGKQFDAQRARQWAKQYEQIVMIAGRYEGVDARIKKLFKMQEISIGPYVLTGGELPAMTVVDAVARHIPGVLGHEESLEERRHGIGLPAYTRPEVFTWRGKQYRVSKILLSGDHKKIDQWRQRSK